MCYYNLQQLDCTHVAIRYGLGLEQVLRKYIAIHPEIRQHLIDQKSLG